MWSSLSPLYVSMLVAEHGLGTQQQVGGWKIPWTTCQCTRLNKSFSHQPLGNLDTSLSDLMCGRRKIKYAAKLLKTLGDS